VKRPEKSGRFRRRSGSLPTKITGIVFWGLVVVGILVTVPLITYLEHRLTAEREVKLEIVISNVVRLIERDPSQNVLLLQPELDQLRRRLGLESLIVRFHNQRVVTGTFNDELDIQSGTFTIRAVAITGEGGLAETGYITIHQVPLATRLAEYRKNILFAMAGLFLGFGFILQFILQRVISRPFMQMLETAESITGGEKNLRFDDGRQDEFGFLGKFINQALDHLTRQQTTLKAALGQQRAMERALESQKERAEITLYSITDAVIATDHNGNVEYMNPAAEEITGWPRDHARYKPINTILSLLRNGESHAIRLRLTSDDPRGDHGGNIGERSKGAAKVISRDGLRHDVEYSVAPIIDRKGHYAGSVIVLTDLTEAQAMAQKLSYQATHDSLTGLINRREFDRRIQELLDEVHANPAHSHGLLFMDLDQFKMINDNCGHVAGDEMLRQLSEHLRHHIGPSDTLARLGGDEFGVLVHNASVHQAEKVANRLREAVEGFRFAWEGKAFTLGVSIGLVPINQRVENRDSLLSMADRACYTAKDKGRNRVKIYQPDDISALRRRRDSEWIARLRLAMDEGRLALAAQPIVPIEANRRGGQMYEILVRFIDEDQQPVSAAVFLPAAERYSLMPELDRWVVRHVFDWIIAQRDRLASLDTCMINLSGQTLNDDKFAAFIVECLYRTGLPGRRVCFEITETTAITNLAQASGFIRQLKTYGCRFALDDFGSGMSSFGYLKNLPVDYVKIDGAFVKDILIDEIDLAMVRSINEIGHIMGKQTIAEYVEDDGILDALRTIGVDYAQGFGIAKPFLLSDLLPAPLPDQRANSR